MRNRESPAVDTLLIAGIAIGCISIAAVLMPAGSASQASAASTASAATEDGPGYLPAQYVNQAKDIEPMPQTF
jgi:hypothetical protein